MSTASRVRKSSPVKQGPMRATIPMASLLRHSGGLRKSPTLSPTSTWRTRTSPDSSPSGQRSPGSLTYKAKSKTLSGSASEGGALGGPGSSIRRTASLDTIYLKGQWPRDSFYLHSGLLQVDKATQTEDPSSTLLRSRLATEPSLTPSSLPDDKLEKLFRQRLQRRQASAECSSQTAPVNIPVKPLPKAPMRSSIEGLNQEIERLVLKPACCVEVTPEGHRAPLADLLRCTRSVNTQTPAEESPSAGSSPDDTEGAGGARLGTSPHINRFLAREPPDGCERVALRSAPGRDARPALKPEHTFQLRPSLGSAFQPIHNTAAMPIVPKQDIM